MNDQKLYILKKSYRILKKQTLFELLNIGRFDMNDIAFSLLWAGLAALLLEGPGTGGEQGRGLSWLAIKTKTSFLK